MTEPNDHVESKLSSRVRGRHSIWTMARSSATGFLRSGEPERLSLADGWETLNLSMELRGVVFLGGVWAKWVGAVACDNKLR